MATTSEIATELPASQDWRDILVELLPAQGSWSEEEYLVLTDHRSRLVEFTDGFLEVLPTPTDKHQSVLKFLFLALFGFVEPRGRVTRNRKRSAFCGCAAMLTRKQASIVAGLRRRRWCWLAFQYRLPRCSTPIDPTSQAATSGNPPRGSPPASADRRACGTPRRSSLE